MVRKEVGGLMELALNQEARLEQTLSPRLIQFYELLACPMQELQAAISREVLENPALELVDEPLPEGDLAWQPPSRGRSSSLVGEADDPVARVPAPISLKDHLRFHFLAVAKTAQERRIGLYLIDSLNDDGYLSAGIGEIAMILGCGVIAVESTLEVLQQLDPAGVGARDLRECLQLQVRAQADDGRAHTVAARLLEECWPLFSKNRLGDCARKLSVSPAAVEDAAEWLRRHCQPYPGRQFGEHWQHAAANATVTPEVTIRENSDGEPPYLAMAVHSRRLTLRIDRTYSQLDRAIREGAGVEADERTHVQTLVRRARQFIVNLTQRLETVRRVAQEAANEQGDYLRHGAARLKPLTRIEIARRLNVHESTVGRAVNGKHVELPTHSIVALETFFDSSQPLRLAIEQLVAAEDKRRPLSDEALAARLTELGFDVARRTVTKYRLALRLPTAQQRRVR